ncbi:hypothetical protein VUR80DRAFT_724 [Thermomyces stellatus]
MSENRTCPGRLWYLKTLVLADELEHMSGLEAAVGTGPKRVTRDLRILIPLARNGSSMPRLPSPNLSLFPPPRITRPTAATPTALENRPVRLLVSPVKSPLLAVPWLVPFGAKRLEGSWFCGHVSPQHLSCPRSLPRSPPLNTVWARCRSENSGPRQQAGNERVI